MNDTTVCVKLFCEQKPLQTFLEKSFTKNAYAPFLRTKTVAKKMKDNIVCVVGLGYVGLPLAQAFTTKIL